MVLLNDVSLLLALKTGQLLLVQLVFDNDNIVDITASLHLTRALMRVRQQSNMD